MPDAPASRTGSIPIPSCSRASSSASLPDKAGSLSVSKPKSRRAATSSAAGSARGVVAVRDVDGEIRVLVNRCAHRGAEYARQPGVRQAFICPYHKWTYDLSGALMGLPFAAAFGAGRDARRFPARITTPAAPCGDRPAGVVFACSSATWSPSRPISAPRCSAISTPFSRPRAHPVSYLRNGCRGIGNYIEQIKAPITPPCCTSFW